MECSIKGCKKIAKHTYNIGGLDGVKFNYCDRHEIIPKKQMLTIKNGYWKRMED